MHIASKSAPVSRPHDRRKLQAELAPWRHQPIDTRAEQKQKHRNTTLQQLGGHHQLPHTLDWRIGGIQDVRHHNLRLAHLRPDQAPPTCRCRRSHHQGHSSCGAVYTRLSGSTAYLGTVDTVHLSRVKFCEELVQLGVRHARWHTLPLVPWRPRSTKIESPRSRTHARTHACGALAPPISPAISGRSSRCATGAHPAAAPAWCPFPSTSACPPPAPNSRAAAEVVKPCSPVRAQPSARRSRRH
jgi:hypothetical protein